MLLAAVAVATLGGYWFYKNSGPVSTDEKFVYFIINKGASVSQIGNKLESAGLIKSAMAFKVYLQFSGQTSKVQAGEFRLSPSFSLLETAKTLMKGPVEIWVTIPEGLRREEVAQKFASTLDKDNAFITEFLEASKGKEGYLFPETYLFPRDVTAATVVKKMTDTFTSKTGNLKNNSGLSLSQVIVLASLIERETKTDEERPVVAGIMLNRLSAGMPLQIDASVQYGVGTSKNWWPVLTLGDIAKSSPYNTYKNKGLPPTPIANPGISSLRAAFSPKDTDYWYYIHDLDGKIHYAETLDEHNANIARYLK